MIIIISGIVLNPRLRKILYVILWYIIYPQLVYMWLVSDVFQSPENLLMVSALVMSYFVGALDTYFRPLSDSISDDWETSTVYNLILLGLFIFHPFLVVLAFKENQMFIVSSFPLLNEAYVSVIGILLILIGGIVTVTGRAQLSRFGSGILQIEDDHSLITTGIYEYVRHPIYAGGLLGIIGIYLAFRSLLTLTAVTILYFLIMRHRIGFEEEMLIKEFGDEYKNYMKKTKKLIPYVY